MITKKSYGIICINKNKILMIRKALSYYFYNFVFNQYKNTESNLHKIFNNMTYNEKIDILSLDYSVLWHKIFPFTNDDYKSNNTYIKKKSKFETNFLRDGGHKLKNMISNSKSVNTIWELPKGRINNDEKNIDTSIREFEEETGIKRNQYKILWFLNPYIESYIDDDIKYINTYYYAELIQDFIPNQKFYYKQITNEISDIRWISIDEIKYLGQDLKTEKRLIYLFKRVLKKYKNHKKYKIINHIKII